MKISFSPHSRISWVIDSLLLTLFLTFLFFLFLGARPLFVPDEGRYAEIAREMFMTGNWITPHLNEIKYFEKPPLFYWLETIFIYWGGVTILSVRLVNACVALFGSWLTYAVARRLYDRQTGLIAALILATSALYFVMARMVSLDLSVSIWMAGCLYCFLLAVKEKCHYWFYSAAIFSALAVLTKGLMGVVLPGLIILLWSLGRDEWRWIKNLSILGAFLLFLLLTLPWHWLVMKANPEFFHFYFIEQHILRYSVHGIGHDQPWWFFIPCIILGFFPWIFFLPQALICHCRDKWDSFFVVWFLVIFIFFSISKSKLIPYILPLFPALSILVARYLVASHPQGKKIGAWLLCLVSWILLCIYLKTPTTLLPVNAYAYITAILMLLCVGTLLFALLSPLKSLFSFYGLVAITSIMLLMTMKSIPLIETRSILPLVKQLKPELQPNTEVIAYHRYYQDLPFYLGQRITIVEWKNELQFGMKHQNTRDWMINEATFWQRWHQPKRLFVILGLDDYAHLILQRKERIYLLGKTLSNALISNQSSA